MFKDTSIHECSYCGEYCSGKYCKSCGTQKGRKEIFDANVAIFKVNEKLGYNIPKVLKNWK